MPTLLSHGAVGGAVPFPPRQTEMCLHIYTNFPADTVENVNLSQRNQLISKCISGSSDTGACLLATYSKDGARSPFETTPPPPPSPFCNHMWETQERALFLR